MGHAGHDEAPARDDLERVREAGRQAELDVLHQHLLKDLRGAEQETSSRIVVHTYGST